jgi:hypothetical protein
MPMSHLPGNHEDDREGHEKTGRSGSRLIFLVLFVFLVVTIWTLRTGQATPDLLAYSWLYLRDAGFDVLGLVNNRALDFGPAGLAETVSRLQEAGIATVGVGPNRRLGFACDSQTVRLSSVEACRPVNVPQVPKTGPFRTGAIDLTGDGVAEQVRLEEQQVIVCRDGVEVWRGLPEWRVVDLALGDPNDDGRSELLLALCKPDAAGVPRDSTEPSSRDFVELSRDAQAEGLEVSHPFIIGYHEGAYRILWGGSAVADPIREVELGDVDGDGMQELIVLEERGDGCAVTVWRWHGWGFSLMWHSPPGRYRDLALIAGEAGHPPIISVAVES